MAAYRLYFLNAKGAIQARQDFAAENDHEAKIVSERILQTCTDCYQGYELWQAARFIGQGSGVPSALVAISLEGREIERQMRILEIEELLLTSHWRISQSQQLLTATETLRRDLAESGATALTEQDITRYVCAATDAAMMSLQLAEGARLMLRGSRGFDRFFDEYFAVVASAHCACGVAFQDARQIVVPAIESSPIYAGHKSLEVLRAQGVAACVSTPFHGRDGGVAGMFSILRDTVWQPADGELAQLQHIANDISAAIADPLGIEAQRIRAAA